VATLIILVTSNGRNTMKLHHYISDIVGVIYIFAIALAMLAL
jgi:hypothetical protein